MAKGKQRIEEAAKSLPKKKKAPIRTPSIIKEPIVVALDLPMPAAKLEVLLNKAPRSKMPGKLQPMKATLVQEPFDDPGWLYEIKWDGYRSLAVIGDGDAKLISRNNISFEQFSPITEALSKLMVKTIIDGEIVVLGADGKSVFSAIQNWQRRQDGQLVYNIFDILWCEGHDLTGLPLTERKEILEAIVQENETIRLSKAFAVKGIDFFHAAEKAKLEGIMAKKADSTYSAGDRSKKWLKIKVKRRQEVVIGGFTRKKGTSKLFSALVLGVYDQKVLRYIGKVGTGWSDKLQKELMEQFKPLITEACPFGNGPDVDERMHSDLGERGAKTTWLQPVLVCEINFAEITGDGKVRQASFKGMRKDKDARKVILEVPADTTATVKAVDEDSE